MQSKNYEKMPLGIFAWFGYELSLQESLRKIKAAGFDQVLLWWGEFEGDIPLLKQPEAAYKIGLKVENAHAPFQNCNALWTEGIDGDDYAFQLINCINGCADTGIPVLVVHLTDQGVPPDYHLRGIERLKRVVETAERRKVILAFENLQHASHLEKVMDCFTSSYVGFCYDSGHHHCACQNIPFLPKYGNRLAALHLHDNYGIKDLHRLPFDGDINWEFLAKQLADTGYQGGVSLEVQSFTGYEDQMDAEQFLKCAYFSATKIRTFLSQSKIFCDNGQCL